MNLKLRFYARLAFTCLLYDKRIFQVRKVLSKKFGYLDAAYKIFFAGLVFVIITFLIIVTIYS